jgi:hypothetical protein
MKIAVVGSRNWKDEMLIQHKIFEYFYGNPIIYDFISGGANGVDKIAEKWIDYLNDEKYIIWRNPNAEYLPRQKTKKIIFLPDWDKYGKSAGYIRNKLIVEEADKIIAFWDGHSKGTKHTIDLAIEAKKPIDIYIRS